MKPIILWCKFCWYWKGYFTSDCLFCEQEDYMDKPSNYNPYIIGVDVGSKSGDYTGKIYFKMTDRKEE